MEERPRFVSYAQNQEDVVLSRLLPLVDAGRYIDVGAGHPVLENVTYALYERGWRGINVEPMSREAAMLREIRPDDTTECCAVGAAPGVVTLYEAPLDNRGATTSDAAAREQYERDGVIFPPFEAPVVTLSSLLGRFEPGAVHVVKIDVEGMEDEVLAGADLAVHRPWVLVIEATVPNSAVVDAHRWESIVEAADYRFVLFDGLNRFYVRSDLHDIAELLSTPANVFDRWVPMSVIELEDLREHAAQLADAIRHKDGYIESLLRDLGTAGHAPAPGERHRSGQHDDQGSPTIS